MSEAGDYTPASYWGGHDFDDAKKHYDRHVGRSYDDAVSKGKKAQDLIPKSISTQSTVPMVVLIDVTGSMGEWPKTIFSKLPYFEHEAQEYFETKDIAISWGAIGDAHTPDKYPLQVREFSKGVDLKTRLEELVIEGGGGGQEKENYELGALYYARNVSMPNAISPLLIIIGDEEPYDYVDQDFAKEFAYITLEKRLTTKQIFEELKRRYSVYLIRKPYNDGGENKMSDTDKRMYRHWADLLGEDYISILPDPGRVVDVIFGIFAKETGKIAEFRDEIEGRQRPDQVGTVYKSLKTIHAVEGGTKKKLAPGHSVTRRKNDDGKGSKPLL